MSITTLQGDCRDVLKTLPDKSIQCCVTSPPYFGLRKYSDDPREIGQEAMPDEYVQALVEVFREVRRVLRDDGTVWLNLGTSYCSGSIKTEKSAQDVFGVQRGLEALWKGVGYDRASGL